MADVNQPTRKQRRDQARQERLEREQEERARAQRTRRLWQVGGALVLAAAIVIAAIAISSSSGGGPSGLAKGKQANQTAASVTGLLSGIPQSGSTLGSPKAPVTVQYFGDLECPVCRAFTLGAFPQLVSQNVRGGQVKVVYRSLQTATGDTSTFVNQQAAALAAGQQNRMWDYVELFYHEQGEEGTGYVTESYLSGIAQQVPGLNLSAWQAARRNPALAGAVSADQQAASAKGYDSTPTLVISGPRGTKVEVGEVPYSTLSQDVKAVS